MEKFKSKQVFDKDKIAWCQSFTPGRYKTAQNCQCMREFAMDNDITNYFEIGEMGMNMHFAEGLVVAGDVVIEQISYSTWCLRAFPQGEYRYGSRYGNR